MAVWWHLNSREIHKNAGQRSKMCRWIVLFTLMAIGSSLRYLQARNEYHVERAGIQHVQRELAKNKTEGTVMGSLGDFGNIVIFLIALISQCVNL